MLLNTDSEDERKVKRRTHMKPFSTAFDHSFAFCRELTKVGCEDGGSDDRARHGGLE
jgi:hypothetical protein